MQHSDIVNSPTTTHAANEVIEQAKREGCCKKRGAEQGKCHVFIDYADRCQCGERVLPRVGKIG